MVSSWYIKLIVKKKYSVSNKDKRDWLDFTKNLGNLYDKDINFLKQNKKINLTKKIDLHGTSLSEANTIVENLINDCFELGYKKLIVITGKGSRSKNFDNPYRSEKMSVLKYSVPEYIKNNLSLLSKINRITKASQEDGGDGAFYIFLKNNKKL